MSSINAVNGVPSAANAAFTFAQLHTAWNFSGFVTSDCGTVSDLQYTHKVAHTPEQAVALGIAGGTDYK